MTLPHEWPASTSRSLPNFFSRYKVNSLVSCTNWSIFILPTSLMAPYDFPAPRWSQLTTVKNFSRYRVFRLLDVSCDVPGPPCRYRTIGFPTSSDLLRTH